MAGMTNAIFWGMMPCILVNRKYSFWRSLLSHVSGGFYLVNSEERDSKPLHKVVHSYQSTQHHV